MGLKSWCIGAGAIRNLVWDSLHGYVTPARPADVDLAYFDPSDLSSIRDAEIQRSLTAQCPEIPWRSQIRPLFISGSRAPWGIRCPRSVH
nr:nucleotidyltransferase family protein [Burkholderia ubonensis]